MGVAQVNENATVQQASYEAEDGTLYWTLSFYIPYSTLCPTPEQHGKDDVPPMPPSFDAAVRLKELDLKQNAATRKVRDAVDPLFNDIADRTRQGEVLDRLLVGGERQQIEFHLPEEIGWKTEGRRFRVELPPEDRTRPAEMRRFWYLHSDGAMSWHVAFAVRYRDQLTAELAANRVSSLYFLSLLQKLAWPKECDASGIRNLTTDAMLKVRIGPAGAKRPKLFWAQVDDWFKADSKLLCKIHPAATGCEFGAIFPIKPCIEVPGLETCETRSLFFIQDKEFFELIQPKTPKGVLVARRERILDDIFEYYPKRVREIVPDARNVHLLDQAFWADLLTENEASRKAAARQAEDTETEDFPLPDPAQRLCYMFLAGFNQNIIDWANQEASEVLDSLDPIYPSSDDQEEEGFFIRYANPRSLITYVQRSRTLEVGNDHILTCPYAFLIHVLAMNNEYLTRQKEKRAFDVIKWVSGKLPSYDPHGQEKLEKDRLAGVEQQINRLRIDSFEHFDRHRYFNPFRYDTERDVFEELERLRGMSRLEVAYKEALNALEEQARDLERIRADTESEQESRREKRLAALFGLIGFSGIGQLLFNWYDYLHPDEPRIYGGYDYTLWVLQALLVGVMVAGMLAVLPGRRKKD